MASEEDLDYLLQILFTNNVFTVFQYCVSNCSVQIKSRKTSELYDSLRTLASYTSYNEKLASYGIPHENN